MASLHELLLDRSRSATALLRHNTRRVARLATRFNRAGAYLWDLLVWSRIEAARAGLIPLDLSETLLARKGVRHPPPTLRVDAPGGRFACFGEGFAAVNAILFANLQVPDTLSPHRYALPGPAFRGVYLWDSAFIAQIWRTWDREVAVDLLRSVVALRDGDRLQHVVADFVQSAFTQPPLLAWSLAELLEDAVSDQAISLAAEFYPPLRAYHRWLQQHRQLPSGLFAWQHPYESGIDNSPRFSTRDERRFEATADLAAPDFSTYMVLQAEALAKLARVLGRDADAREHADDADRVRAAIDRRLWHDDDGLYYDRHELTRTWTRTRTVASLLPLWAGAGAGGRAARLCAQIMSPEKFGSLMPLPTVAIDDPAFERDMWRGPVWLNTAYATVLGLRRHGFLPEAAELAWRLCEGVYQVFEHERQIYEFYDPTCHSTGALRRKRGNWWKRFTLGSGPQREFVGWSGLVNPLVIGVLFGFGREHGRRVLRPAFPPAAVGSLLHLRLPAEQLAIEIAVETPDRVQGFVQGAAGLRRFTAGFATRVDLDAVLEGPVAPTTPAAPAIR